MPLKKEGKSFFKQDLDKFEDKPKKLSLSLHIMPKTENSHFQKWLILAFLIFVLIILALLFFL